MIKQMLKLAGVKSEKEFLKKFPTEQSFLNAYPEASMLLNSANMNYYADGGEMMAGPQGGGMPPQEQGMPSEQDVAAQQEQIVQFIVQLLQQNVPPPEIIQQLVQAGLPEDQAAQLVNAVIQQMEGQMQGPSPEEQQMMEASAPEGEQLGQEPVPGDTAMMRMGGKPCYKCGGKYKKGGSTYSGTYSAGVYYANGGPAFTPDYGMMAMGGSYNNPGFKALPPEVQNKIKNSSKAMYGGSFAGGGMTNECPEGTIWDEELQDCLPIEEGMNGEMSGVGELVPAGTPSPRLNAGFGLGNKGFNADYKFGINPMTKSDISHDLRLSFPNLFKKDKGITIGGSYSPNRLLHADISSPNIPLFGGNLNFNAAADKILENEKPTPLMQIAGTRPTTYTAGISYEKELGLKKGRGLKVRGSLDYRSQQYGGLTKFVGGGESMEAGMEQEQMGQQEAMMQELMVQVGEMLQQGAQPEQIIPQLVQMGMSEEQAMQFIQMTAQQMGAGGGQGAVMPMEVGMYGGSFARGGMFKQYKRGGEYDLNESEIQDLVNKGYKIQYM